MSFSGAHQARSFKPIVAVGLLHAVIAYGFISGLAYRVIPYDDPPIVATNIPDDIPPPPTEQPLPRQQSTKHTVLAAPDPLQRPALDRPEDVVLVPTLDAGTETRLDPQQTILTPPLRQSLARAATVVGDRAGWVTADDYPATALRQEAEGTVGINVAIGADGRVTACDVVQPSGNASLDQATCRTYARRARFTPALDDEGRPVAAHRADRVRWRLPAQ